MTTHNGKANSDAAAGCLIFLILSVMIALWQYTLLLISICGIGYGLFRAIKAYSRLYLEQDQSHAAWWLGATVRASGKQLVGRLCRYHDQYHLIDGFTSAASRPDQAWIHVCTRGLRESDGGVSAVRGVLQFDPPADMRRLRRARQFVEFLSSCGLDLIDELSVDGKAVRASLDCLEQMDWARGSLQKLSGLEKAVIATLSKAHGNELLEPSIPQLQQALESFEEQRGKLTQHIKVSRLISKKLFDYLAVPDGVRSIINFDLDAIIDFSAFKDLEDSFNEVVAINDAFRELNRDRIV